MICFMSNPIGYSSIGFTNWNLCQVSQGDLFMDWFNIMNLYGLPCITIQLLVLKLTPDKLKSMQFLEYLMKFYLYLHIPIYNISPYVTCLGLSFGRGWNLVLEGSYLLNYKEYEVETNPNGISTSHLWHIQFPSPYHSPKLSYSKKSQMTIFFFLGFQV